MPPKRAVKVARPPNRVRVAPAGQEPAPAALPGDPLIPMIAEPVKVEAFVELKRQIHAKYSRLQRAVANKSAYINRDLLERFRTEYPALAWYPDYQRTNPHGVSAAYRLAAIRSSLIYEIGAREKFCLQNIYPSDRESNFKDAAGELVLDHCLPPKLPILRGDSKVSNNPPRRNDGDVALMVDIYALGDKPLTLQHLADVLESPRTVIWIGRLHTGEAGWNTDEVWIREGGLVKSRPPNEHYWPLHPGFTLHEHHGETVHFGAKKFVASVVVLREHGPYHLIHITWDSFIPDMPNMSPTPKLEGKIEVRRIPYKTGSVNWWRCGDWQLGGFGCWPYGPSGRDVPVYLPAWNHLADIRGRVGHGANFDATLAKIRALMNNPDLSPGMKTFCAQFPEYSGDLIENTASWCLYAGKVRQVEAMAADRNGTGDHDRLLQEMRGTTYFGNGVRPNWKRLGLIAIVCGLLGILFGVSRHLISEFGSPDRMHVPDVQVPFPFNDKDASPFPPGPPSMAVLRRRGRRMLFPAVAETPSTHNRIVPYLPFLLSFGTVFLVLIVVLLKFAHSRRRSFWPLWRTNPLVMRTTEETAFDDCPEVALPIDRVEAMVPIYDPASLRAEIEVSQGGLKLDLSDFHSLPTDPDPPGLKMWALAISTDVPLPPGATLRNAVTALATRNVADHGVTEGPEVHELWRRTTERLLEAGMFPSFTEFVTDDASVAATRSTLSKRLWTQACDQKYRLGLPTKPIAAKYSLKMDETLQPKDDGEFITLKARIIGTVDPRYHTETVPVATDLKHALDAWWRDNIITLPNHGPCRFYFGAALSVDELDSLVDTIISRAEIAIVVAGDDSLVYVQGRWLTADYSAFDSTQTVGNLKIASDLWMTKMGAPRTFMAFFQEVYEGEYTMFHRKRDWLVRGAMPYQFQTGLAITTLNNTVSNALAIAGALLLVECDLDRMEGALRQFGLKPKVNLFSCAEGVDFLKGVYISSEDGGYTWHRMPSSVLKLGKILKDPAVLMKQAKLPYEGPLARKFIAYSMALGLKTSDRECPILGDILKTYDAFSPLFSHSRPLEMNQIIESPAYSRLTRVSRPIARSTWLALMDTRYGISPPELEDFSAMIRAARASEVFPFAYTSPVTAKLRDVDY